MKTSTTISLATMALAGPLLSGCGDARSRADGQDGYLRGNVSATAAQGSALTLMNDPAAGKPMTFLLRYGEGCTGTFPQATTSTPYPIRAARSIFAPQLQSATQPLNGKPVKGAAVVVMRDPTNATGPGGIVVLNGEGASFAQPTGQPVYLPMAKGESASCTMRLEQIGSFNQENGMPVSFAAQTGGLVLGPGGLAKIGQPVIFTPISRDDTAASGFTVANSTRLSTAWNGFINESDFNNATNLYNITLYYADTANLVTPASLLRNLNTIVGKVDNNFPTINLTINNVAPPNYRFNPAEMDDPLTWWDDTKATFFLNNKTGGVDNITGVNFRPSDPSRADAFVPGKEEPAPVYAQKMYINTGYEVPFLLDSVTRQPSVGDFQNGRILRTYGELKDHLTVLSRSGLEIDLTGGQGGVVIDPQRPFSLAEPLLKALRYYNGLADQNKCGYFQYFFERIDRASGLSSYQGGTALIPAVNTASADPSCTPLSNP